MGERLVPDLEFEADGRFYLVVELSGDSLNFDADVFDQYAFLIHSQEINGEKRRSFLNYIVTASPDGDLMYVFSHKDPHREFMERLELADLLSAGLVKLELDHYSKVVCRKIFGCSHELQKIGELSRGSSEWYQKNVLGQLLRHVFVIE